MGNKDAHLRDQIERLKAMKREREEAVIIAAENRISRALKSNTPPAANYTLKTGQTLMVYSKKQCKWVKNLTVVRVGSKMSWVNDEKRFVKINCTHVIPQPRDQDKSNISDLLRLLSPLDSHLPPSVLITEVLSPNDPRELWVTFTKL